jgi:hypothetical protein
MVSSAKESRRLVAEVIRIHGQLFERFGCTHVAGVIGEINRDGFSPSGVRSKTLAIESMQSCLSFNIIFIFCHLVAG